MREERESEKKGLVRRRDKGALMSDTMLRYIS